MKSRVSAVGMWWGVGCLPATALVFGLVAWSFSGTTGHAPARGDETREIVDRLTARGKTYRVVDLDGYVRAFSPDPRAPELESQRRLAHDPVEVIAAESSKAEELVDPLGALVFRVALAGGQSQAFGQRSLPAVVHCYRVAFSYYGREGDPDRVGCPDTATPVAYPQAPPRREIPDGAEGAVRRALRSLPAAADARTVRAAIMAELGEPPTWPDTGEPRYLLPEILVAFSPEDASAIGVVLREPDENQPECLVLTRADGRIVRHSPSPEQQQAGEAGCSPGTYLRS